MPGSRSGPKKRAAAVAAALVLLAVPDAEAFIPTAERIAGAIAETNEASGRTQAVRIELRMRIGDGEPVARGELVSHPSGLARLELRGARGLVERHLLQGSEHTASRNGEPLESPRAFLPPFFLLQSDSGLTLRAAMESFGADIDSIAIIPCGSSDCFVIGDPALAPTRPEPAFPTEDELLLGERLGELGATGNPESPRGDGGGPDPDGAPPAAYAKVWLDSRSYELVRLESTDGVVVRLGPLAQWGDLRLPKWLEVVEEGRVPVRFEFDEAALVNAPAGAFNKSWLAGSRSRADDSGSGPASDPDDQPGAPAPRPRPSP